MSGFALGTKKASTQTFNQEGKRIPTTYIHTTPCYLVDVKYKKDPSYCSVLLSFGTSRKTPKPVKGTLKKAGLKESSQKMKQIRITRFIKDIQLIEEANKKGITIGDVKVMVGDVLNPTVLFKVGESVDVSGISKGKGFQGVVKRHGFRGGPKTHGQSNRWRAPGSMGQTTTPGHTYKGKRMAGRMGNDRVTLKNLPVIAVDEHGLTVKGLVPGHKDSVLEVVTHTN